MALQSATIFLRLFLLLDDPPAPIWPPTMAEESPKCAAPAPAAPAPCPGDTEEEELGGVPEPAPVEEEEEAGVLERDRLGEVVEEEECECPTPSTCIASPRASKSRNAVAVLSSKDSSTYLLIVDIKNSIE